MTAKSISSTFFKFASVGALASVLLAVPALDAAARGFGGGFGGGGRGFGGGGFGGGRGFGGGGMMMGGRGFGGGFQGGGFQGGRFGGYQGGGFSGGQFGGVGRGQFHQGGYGGGLGYGRGYDRGAVGTNGYPGVTGNRTPGGWQGGGYGYVRQPNQGGYGQGQYGQGRGQYGQGQYGQGQNRPNQMGGAGYVQRERVTVQRQVTTYNYNRPGSQGQNGTGNQVGGRYNGNNGRGGVQYTQPGAVQSTRGENTSRYYPESALARQQANGVTQTPGQIRQSTVEYANQTTAAERARAVTGGGSSPRQFANEDSGYNVGYYRQDSRSGAAVVGGTYDVRREVGVSQGYNYGY